jgi:hypothetical protein
VPVTVGVGEGLAVGLGDGDGLAVGDEVSVGDGVARGRSEGEHAVSSPAASAAAQRRGRTPTGTRYLRLR